MDKPKFDPNKPFTKPPFDPSQPFDSSPEPAEAAPETGMWEKFKNFAGAAGSAGANAVTMGYLPDVMDKRAELVGGETGDEFKARTAEAAQKSPAGALAGAVAGSSIPGAGFGKLGSLATKIGNNPLTRMGGAVGSAYAQGYAQKPGEGQTREENAATSGKWAAGISGGLEALLGAAKLAKPVARGVGKMFTGLKPKEVDDYVRDPFEADRLAEMNKTDPMGLSSRVKETVKGDLDEAFERVSRPTLKKAELALAQKRGQVRPDQFQGTAAGSEIQRTHNLMDKTRKLDVPVSEVVRSTPVQASINKSGAPQVIQPEVQMTPVGPKIVRAGKQQIIEPEISMSPVEANLKYGKPQTQNIPYDESFGYDRPSVQVSSAKRSIDRAGKDVVLRPEVRMSPVETQIKRAGKTEVIQPEVQMTPVHNEINPTQGTKTGLEDLLLQNPDGARKAAQVEGFVPRGAQQVSVPAPMGESISMTGPQMLRAKRASQAAAYDNEAKAALTNLVYRSSDDAEAVAAANMRKALEGIAPETAGLNDVLEESARYSSHAKHALKNNPAAILTDSESLGSVPMRSMRQFLDKNGGSKLEDMAGSLSAGRAMNDPNRVSGLRGALAQPIGKKLLRSAHDLKSYRRQDDSLANILASIFNSTKE